MTGLEALFPGGRGQEPPDETPSTAKVVRSDDAGVFVAPTGDDIRNPIGPVLGARRRNQETGDLEQLPVGTTVLLVWTDDDPWVAAWEED